MTRKLTVGLALVLCLAIGAALAGKTEGLWELAGAEPQSKDLTIPPAWGEVIGYSAGNHGGAVGYAYDALLFEADDGTLRRVRIEADGKASLLQVIRRK